MPRATCMRRRVCHRTLPKATPAPKRRNGSTRAVSSVTRQSNRVKKPDQACGGHPKSNRSMPTTKSRYHGSTALPMAPIQARDPVRVFGIAPVEFLRRAAGLYSASPQSLLMSQDGGHQQQLRQQYASGPSPRQQEAHPRVDRAALARVVRAAARTRLSRIRTTLVFRNFRSPIWGLTGPRVVEGKLTGLLIDSSHERRPRERNAVS